MNEHCTNLIVQTFYVPAKSKNSRSPQNRSKSKTRPKKEYIGPNLIGNCMPFVQCLIPCCMTSGGRGTTSLAHCPAPKAYSAEVSFRVSFDNQTATMCWEMQQCRVRPSAAMQAVTMRRIPPLGWSRATCMLHTEMRILLLAAK
jgi:hypothetical protein